MKSIVKTTGSFSLNDSAENQYVDMNRPCVVVNSYFIQQQLGRGQLEVLGTLPDEARDADFAEHFAACEGDVDLAIESYRSVLETPAEGEGEGEGEGGETTPRVETKTKPSKKPK